MKSTYQDRIGAFESSPDHVKRMKLAQQMGGGSQVFNQQGPTSPFGSSITAQGTNSSDLLAALQRNNPGARNMLQSASAPAPTGGLQAMGNNQDELLRSVLLREQMLRSNSASAPQRGNEIQDLILSQFSRNGAAGNHGLPLSLIAGQATSLPSLGNLDVLTRAAALSDTNRAIEQLLAAQNPSLLEARLTSTMSSPISSLNQLSSAQADPNSRLLSELLSQQNQPSQYMLGTSIGASLPDAAFRQMAPVPAPAGALFQTTSLEDRLRALRSGIVDKNQQVSSVVGLDQGAPPTMSFEGDRLTPMALASEQWVMSEYQCLLRQQIMFVQASANENGGKTQGRNKPIVAGQVGILCRHCARVPPRNRPRGAVYFPAMLHRIYQAAQNMAHNHFAGSCQMIPEETRKRLMLLKEQKVITVGAGKEYWVSAAMTVGVREGEEGLFFENGSAEKKPQRTASAAAEAVGKTEAVSPVKTSSPVKVLEQKTKAVVNDTSSSTQVVNQG